MRYWKHFGTALYPVLGGQGALPGKRRAGVHWMKVAGVCEKRHSCPESAMCREEGL